MCLFYTRRITTHRWLRNKLRLVFVCSAPERYFGSISKMMECQLTFISLLINFKPKEFTNIKILIYLQQFWQRDSMWIIVFSVVSRKQIGVNPF